MDKALFYIIFFLLCILYFIVGYIVSRSVKSIEDYFLAGRKLTFYQVAISLIATQLGGGFILGTSQEAYNKGYYGLFYVVGISIGFIILASGIAAKLRLLQVSTTAQLFETQYGSKFLKRIASVCSIVSLVGIFAAQIIGSKSLMVSLDVYDLRLFLLFWFIIILYAMVGGLRGIVQNDIFQLSFIIVIFLGLFIFDFFSNLNIAGSVFSQSPGIIKYQPDWSHLIIIPLMPALYALIEQDLAQIFFAARNSATAVMAAWSAAIFLIIFAFIPLYFGMKAHVIGLELKSQCNPLIYLFDQTYNCVIVTFITYGVFAAIISTANGVLCAISSNIVQDFNLATKSSKYQLFISRTVMLLVGIIAVYLSFRLDNLIQVLVDSYAVPVTALLIPLLFVYYKSENTKLSRLAAYFSVFAGLGTFLILLLSKKTLIITAEIDALLISAFGYLVGFIIDRARVSKH